MSSMVLRYDNHDGHLFRVPRVSSCPLYVDVAVAKNGSIYKIKTNNERKCSASQSDWTLKRLEIAVAEKVAFQSKDIYYIWHNFQN